LKKGVGDRWEGGIIKRTYGEFFSPVKNEAVSTETGDFAKRSNLRLTGPFGTGSREGKQKTSEAVQRGRETKSRKAMWRGPGKQE